MSHFGNKGNWNSWRSRCLSKTPLSHWNQRIRNSFKSKSRETLCRQDILAVDRMFIIIMIMMKTSQLMFMWTKGIYQSYHQCSMLQAKAKLIWMQKNIRALLKTGKTVSHPISNNVENHLLLKISWTRPLRRLVLNTNTLWKLKKLNKP